MAVGHELDRVLLRPVHADQVEGVDPEHPRHADAREHARVVRLAQVLEVVQAPAGEAPAPVVVPGAQGEGGERAPEVDAVFGKGAQQERRRLVDDRRLVEVAQVQRPLARPFDRRVAERLLAEAVAAAVRRAVVFPQAEVEAVVGLVGGAGDDVDHRHELAFAQGDEGGELGRLVGLHHRDLGLGEGSPAVRRLAGRQLQIEREPGRGVDPQRREEARRPARPGGVASGRKASASGRGG